VLSVGPERSNEGVRKWGTFFFFSLDLKRSTERAVKHMAGSDRSGH
jgi:hypothetical protein